MLRLYGTHYKDRFDLLSSQKAAIEDELGTSLKWVPARKRKSTHVILSRNNVNPFDEATRGELCDWIAETLVKFQDVAVKLLSLNTSGAKLSVRRKTQLEYWQGVNAILAEQDGEVRARTPRPQHWMNFGLGFARFHMHAAMNTKEEWIRVGITCHGEAAKSNFRKLRDMRGEIEAELGDKLEWEELPHRKESRIGLKQLDTDPLDQSAWPKQHQWVVQKLELMRKVFAPYLNQLNESSA